jgi:hypothetical protein
LNRPTAFDEQFVHQIPELLPNPVTHHPHWRESYFFELHDPAAGPDGDVVFLTLAHYPAQERMDSLQMGRVAGQQLISLHDRASDGDPHTTEVPGARVEVVAPFEELRLWADPETSAVGLDVSFRARTEPYALRRGTMRAGHELIWDQCHIFQSGTYDGSYTAGGVTRAVEGWVGQRDHSWGIRDHARCPLWLWFQIQLDDGFLGVWHWEYANGARVYTDGCWAPSDRSAPVPITDFHHHVRWVGADGSARGYGQHGEEVAGLVGSCEFVLEDRRRLTLDAQGTFARPYEPFYRGGLNLMSVRADDGRTGTAIYEVTGARHHHFFPDTKVVGTLPS